MTKDPPIILQRVVVGVRGISLLAPARGGMVKWWKAGLVTVRSRNLLLPLGGSSGVQILEGLRCITDHTCKQGCDLELCKLHVSHRTEAGIHTFWADTGKLCLARAVRMDLLHSPWCKHRKEYGSGFCRRPGQDSRECFCSFLLGSFNHETLCPPSLCVFWWWWSGGVVTGQHSHQGELKQDNFVNTL